MGLSFEERVAVVERLTAAAGASPGRYRLRVLTWIVLGYSIIGTLLALSVLLSAGVIVLIVTTRAWPLLKFAWIPLLFSWVLGRAIFVRLEAPSGREIRRHEAPQLFAVIDRIRQRLRVPRLDGVLMTVDMNAAVVETPRFGGLFGWHRHLIIGLPMLILLSAEEMKAVLAHELGHLSGRHGRLAAWSWRVRVTWSHVLTSIDAQRGMLVRTLQRLVHWYFEHLMLVTLVLAREHELAADEASAELTSRETAARALAWVAVGSQLIDRRYWTPLWERVASEPQPPRNPVDELRRTRAEILAPPFEDVLETELQRHTAIDDTHPALRARLEHLGVTDPAIALAPRSAADDLLGRTTAAVIVEVDREWREVITPQWEERHRALADARKEVTEAAPLDVAIADDAALHQKAAALVDLGRDAEALPMYETLLSRNADDARAAFHVGRILVQRGDLAGVRHLSQAMERDWTLAVSSCELAYAALREKGLERDAHAWSERYAQQMELLERARQESGTLNLGDQLVPTELSEEVQTRIVDACRAAKWVNTVWIARKKLTTLPTGVDFVAVAAKSFRFSGGDRLQKLADAISTEEPVMVFIIDNGKLMARLNALDARRRL
jgi:Zn-dependent protease with chaperone function